MFATIDSEVIFALNLGKDVDVGFIGGDGDIRDVTAFTYKPKPETARISASGFAQALRAGPATDCEHDRSIAW